MIGARGSIIQFGPPRTFEPQLSIMGFTEADIGGAECVYLYLDINRVPRVLGAHRRDAIASLFAGDRSLLLRLWPGEGCWDAKLAAADLCQGQAELGWQRPPLCFRRPLRAETRAETAAHLAIGTMARRMLYRQTDPFTVLALARGWNAASGAAVLEDAVVVRIVDGACLRELHREGRDHAA